ncbi:YgfZ/GcvT domain-containing protein [Zavarzinella formosa]|uniref:YgfZ/GcvT domain-containing protein n=1 Tax=Zavarzinella formosa TaxID=360055 RepID=UPI00030E67A3|nr:glycine cleavage T C-terminal barrel domain-containing protein [Zavarzinella formosa]
MTKFAAEYETALAAAVLFDRSTQGKIELTGKDAPSFLHNLSTNDIKNLPLGGGCEAYFCSATAKVLAHAFIYHVLVNGKHAFWLDVTAGFNRKLFEHLDKHLISEAVELMDHTENFAQFHLAGPTAAAVLGKALGSPVPDIGEFMHMERTFPNGVTAQIRRHDPLGLPGFDIVLPLEKAEEMKTLLLHSGAAAASDEAYEILRVEAGTPVYGIDIGEDRFVMEVPRPLRAVSYEKGCYLGQEPIVMARDRAGFVNRSFFGVKTDGVHPLPAGTKLYRDTQEVGLVTSSVISPRLKAPVAIGYLRRGHQDTGLKLTAGTGDDAVEAEVLGYPPVAGF